MDTEFLLNTFLRLIAALPMTLEIWVLSVVLGGFIAIGVTWMRVSGPLSFEPFARTQLSFLTTRRIFIVALILCNLYLYYYDKFILVFLIDAFILDAFILAIVLLRRLTGFGTFEIVARSYVFVFRGTPLLVQLFVVYYGLASFPAVRATFLWPLLRSAFFCATLSLALCTAAYQSEIFRMAVAGIPRGQVEAARACGMSGFVLFRRVIFPIALRLALPAYTTEVISMVKATALVSLVTLWDVMSVSLKIRNDTLVTYTPLLVAGAIYFVVNFLLARALAALEYLLSPHLRGRPVGKPAPDVL